MRIQLVIEDMPPGFTTHEVALLLSYAIVHYLPCCDEDEATLVPHLASALEETSNAGYEQAAVAMKQSGLL